MAAAPVETFNTEFDGHGAPHDLTRCDAAKIGKQVADIDLGLLVAPTLTGVAVNLVEPLSGNG
jgi:hypothetical protein